MKRYWLTLVLMIWMFTLLLPEDAESEQTFFPEWRLIGRPANYELWAVDFIDVHEGWAVGDGGSIVHNSNGGCTVILSATTRYLSELIKEHLGMRDIICSEMEVADGKYTGMPLGNYCYGEEKLIQAEKYCAKHGFDLKDAYYYGDSASDMPILEAVGNPMCVTPDKKLEKIAIQRHWTILRWE